MNMSSPGLGFTEELRWKCNAKCLVFFTAISSDDFEVMENSFQTLDADTENAHLPQLSLILEKKNL